MGRTPNMTGNFSGNWQYCVILCGLPTASLFCCGQVVFKAEFICAVSVCVAYCFRAVTPVTTESLPLSILFWPLNPFVRQPSSAYERLFQGFLSKKKFRKHLAKRLLTSQSQILMPAANTQYRTGSTQHHREFCGDYLPRSTFHTGVNTSPK